MKSVDIYLGGHGDVLSITDIIKISKLSKCGYKNKVVEDNSDLFDEK